VLRALLHGEEVDYALGDGAQAASAPTSAPASDAGFIDVDHPVPIYVAADGRWHSRRPAPMATGGCVANLDAGQAAEEPGGDAGWCRRRRPRPARDFHTAALQLGCVLNPARADLDRVIDEIGRWPPDAALLVELYQKDADPARCRRCRNLWDEYLAFTEKWRCAAKRYQQVHLGIAPSCRPTNAASSPGPDFRFDRRGWSAPDGDHRHAREREAMGLNEITLLRR